MHVASAIFFLNVLIYGTTSALTIHHGIRDLASTSNDEAVESSVYEGSKLTARADSSWQDPEIFQKQVQGTQNKFRQQHCASLLPWDSNLAEAAKQQLNLQGCTAKFPFLDQFGANLGYGYNSPQDMVNGWYITRQYYTSPAYHGNSAAFTQLVWRSTNRMGCANIDCRNKGLGYLALCYYYPPGNVGDASTYNANVRGKSNGDTCPPYFSS